MRRYEIVYWSDDKIGHGYELWYRGEYLGTTGSVRILRLWARKAWQQPER